MRSRAIWDFCHEVQPKKCFSNLTSGFKSLCVYIGIEMVFKRKMSPQVCVLEYVLFHSDGTGMLCIFSTDRQRWANINLTCPLKSGSGFKVKKEEVCPLYDRQEKNLSSHSEKLPELRSASHHVTGVTIVILHAYHHPLTPTERRSASSIHCLERHRSFKGISQSCWSYLLPPLNTARESQDSAAVTDNYLWWEICEGKEHGGEEGDKKRPSTEI